MDSNKQADTASRAEVPLEILPLHSTNLLTVLTEDGIIQYESPSIEHIYGYEQTELVGEQVAEYFHPDDRKRVITAFRAVVDNDEYSAKAVEYRHKQADGTYTWVESIASTNPTPNGHYVINTRDITEQKTREQKLERQNERLNEFAGVVSHDLRNPLTVASGRLEVIAEEYESDHIAVIERAHDRMETLIADLLTLAREGDQASDTEVIDLGEFVSQCWQLIENGEATVVTDVDVRLQADRSRLRQLLENLMQNAVVHGGRETTIRIGTLEDGFYVADDGPGIKPEDRAQVFEAGYSTTNGGTGFGLSIVKQVVEAHGWEINVCGAATGGTRFEISAVEFR